MLSLRTIPGKMYWATGISLYIYLYDSGEGFWSGEGGTWNGGVGK